MKTKNENSRSKIAYNSVLSIFGKNKFKSEPLEDLKLKRTMIWMNQTESKWNKAAILLAQENMKVPSKRSAKVCFPIVQNVPQTNQRVMSTNDWNLKALEISRQKDPQMQER